MITRPLLAAAIKDIELLRYPLYASKKLDGIRALTIKDVVVSRKFKAQPNAFVRDTLKGLPNGLDGELMLRNPIPVLGCDLEENGVVTINFNNVQSAIMSVKGEPDFEYWIFDYVKDSLDKPYLKRIEDLKEWYASTEHPAKDRIKLILPVQISNKEDLLRYEKNCLEQGFEGVMLRIADGKYKENRSTVNESILLKLKRFSDAEAVVIGFEERQHNTNEKEKNELGLSKRSSKKEGMIGSNTLGALRVRDEKTHLEFNIGTGFDDAMRKEIWENQDKYLGQLVTYKFQPSGMLEAPRFPVYKSLRSREDLD